MKTSNIPKPVNQSKSLYSPLLFSNQQPLLCQYTLHRPTSYSPYETFRPPRPRSVSVPSNTSTKWSGFPAPEDAITGILTVSFTALISSRSSPEFVQSLLRLFNSSSPHPSASTALARAWALKGRDSRPPFNGSLVPHMSPPRSDRRKRRDIFMGESGEIGIRNVYSPRID